MVPRPVAAEAVLRPVAAEAVPRPVVAAAAVVPRQAVVVAVPAAAAVAVAGPQREGGGGLAAADLAWRFPAAGGGQQAAGVGCAPHLRAAATLRRAAAEIGRAGATGKANPNWQGGNWQHGGRHFRRGPVVTYGFGAPYYDYASPYSYYYGDDCYALRFIRGAYRRVWVCN